MMMRKWRQLESVFVVVALVVALVELVAEPALAVAMQSSLLVTAVAIVAIVVTAVTVFAIVAAAVAVVVALESRDGCENRYRATTVCGSPGPLAHRNAVSTDTVPHSSSTPPYGYRTAEIDIDTVSPYTVD